jgi:hypothetical protein
MFGREAVDVRASGRSAADRTWHARPRVLRLARENPRWGYLLLPCGLTRRLSRRIDFWDISGTLIPLEARHV